MLIIFKILAERLDLGTLNRIAPTVVIDSSDYRQSYLGLAAAFGLESTAQRRLDEYDRAVATAGDTVNAKSRRVSVVTVYPGANITVWVGGPTALPQALLDMGFNLVPDAKALSPIASNNRASISLEQVGVLTGDDLLLCQSSAIEGEDAALQQITSTDTWKLIPAVTGGRVHTVDRLGYPGLPGRIALVDRLLVALG